jgi:diguanylate cyclase (GGDEF)-like protein/putative nucleotidyltransferase with HDIG domain
MSIAAKVYIGIVAAAGLWSIAFGVLFWESQDLSRFFFFLFAAILGSTLKVSLPGITGTLSVNFLFILVGILNLSSSETLALGFAATVVQSFWRAKTKPKPVHLLFNVSCMAIAIAASYSLYHSGFARSFNLSSYVLPGLAACAFFVTNTVPLAVVISLVEKKPVTRLWKECYFWSFPYYLLGAALAFLINMLSRQLDWGASLLVLSVIYLIYYAYQSYLLRLEDEKTLAQENAALHLRTIEALALAIDAKDSTTYEHLRRVKVYAVEIGREMGLGDSDLEALRAAALLHDIGKLAVPEHILSKPGTLTPEEFEKMKIHPLVSAGILERVQFPYAVVPIVRSHHERWDGTGYPDGLKGEEIPVGARIISAVDALDALCTQRQYREALTLERAIERMVSELRHRFDPRVLEILERRYRDFEAIVQSQPADTSKGALELQMKKNPAPAAGSEVAGKELTQGMADSSDFLSSIAAARQEVQVLFELTQDLGTSLSLDDTLSVLAVRLKRMIPYDSVAVYLLRENRLIPQYTNGVDSQLFASLEIPVGEGLSGWVAGHRQSIVNGNPSVEAGYLNDPTRFSILQSGLAVPLDGVNGLVGVISLYRTGTDSFSRDHLRILRAVSPKLTQSIENALRYQQVESSATTDGLTGLPNARSLFLHLESELTRSRRHGTPLAVLVCDLDGFKQVNDRFGHLEGNKVLQWVAKGIRDICRQYDYAARMGGDEFVLVLPGLQSGDLDVVVERLSKVAESAGVEICGERLLSISIGEAFYPADASHSEQLLEIADRRMYRVKHRHHLMASLDIQATAIQ